MEKAIILLGYHLAIEVKKRRYKRKLGELTFCVDQVDDLGDFVEVEQLCDDDVDPVIIQKKLYDQLMSMGLRIEKQMFQG